MKPIDQIAERAHDAWVIYALDNHTSLPVADWVDLSPKEQQAFIVGIQAGIDMLNEPEPGAITITRWAVMQDGNLEEPFGPDMVPVFHDTREAALEERDEWRRDVDSGAENIHIVRIDATITLDKDGE